MKHLRSLRGVLIAAVTTAALIPSAPAHAEVGVGLFIGEPFGFDLKLDLQRNTSLDLLFGTTTVRDGRADYAHMTYLVTPVVGKGRSVLVPLRLGVGAAFFDGGGKFADEVNLAVRAPLEVGIRLRRTPLEFYGELAVKVTFIDENDNHSTVDLDGGIGFRLML